MYSSTTLLFRINQSIYRSSNIITGWRSYKGQYDSWFSASNRKEAQHPLDKNQANEPGINTLQKWLSCFQYLPKIKGIFKKFRGLSWCKVWLYYVYPAICSMYALHPKSNSNNADLKHLPGLSRPLKTISLNVFNVIQYCQWLPKKGYCNSTVNTFFFQWPKRSELLNYLL